MTRAFLKPMMLAALAASTVAAAQTPEFNRRCATRVSAALLGRTPTAAQLTSTNPQAVVDTMLATPEAIDKLARFINASFNLDSGENGAADATYSLAKYVLSNGKPWKEMFIGGYRVAPGANPNAEAVVTVDANGLGYFRSKGWMDRYAGNELEGYRLVAAYRILNNVLGVQLTAAVDTSGVDAAGRKAGTCAGCHYNSTFGLDLVAKVLSKAVTDPVTGAISYTPPNEGPQTLLAGKSISTDKQLVTEMVNSVDFAFNTCRLAAEFLYARPEFKCEGPVFDQCVAAFNANGTLQSAVAAIAKDPGFCQ